MALLNKIRERSGVAVGVIAFGLILFLLGADFLSPNSFLLNNNDVGEIDGTTITMERFNEEVSRQENNFMGQYGQRPNEAQMRSIRDNAWRKLINDIAFVNQYQEVGVIVSTEEQIDMVQGNNVSPEIQQLFRNPDTQEFDKSQLLQFLQSYNEQPAEVRAQWNAIEKQLMDARERIKYENLLIKSAYVTTAEAKRDYELQAAVAEARFVYVPYYSIADSTITVTDSDLRNYYNNHREKYTVDKESRDMSFVTFSILPSAADSAAVMKDMEEIAEELAATTNDSVYARNNAASSFGYYGKQTPKTLPDFFNDKIGAMQAGEVYGPMVEGERYVVYKVAEVVEDTVAFARASHILIQPQGQTDEAKAEAREKAQDILRQIQNGADFAEMAAQHGTDGTSTRGGDLGWFDKATMVTEFSDAVFGTSRAGLLSNLVETQFGYHIIEVTAAPSSTSYVMAKVDAEIFPSDATTNEAYRMADMFREEAGGTLRGMEEAAQANNYRIQTADNVLATAYNLQGLANSREIVRWAFNDGETGKVADEIFQAEDAFVIAAMSGLNEAGTASFEAVRANVRAEVIKEKKAEAIIAKLGDVKNSTIDEIAANYGPDATINTTTDLRANTNSMPGIGFAPKAVGAAFGLQEGQISAPVKETNGVVVVKLEALTAAPARDSYASNRSTLENQRRARITNSISTAIEEGADIEDRRFRVQ